MNVVQQNVMRGIMQTTYPWLVWAWCYAHHLELSCKNSLTSTLFKDIEEMLLRLYFLYKKSPKKTSELEKIMEELHKVFEFRKGGNKPVVRMDEPQTQGTSACSRSIWCIINHLTTLS